MRALHLVRRIESERLAARDAELRNRVSGVPLISIFELGRMRQLLDRAAETDSDAVRIDYLERLRDLVDGVLETARTEKEAT